MSIMERHKLLHASVFDLCFVFRRCIIEHGKFFKSNKNVQHQQRLSFLCHIIQVIVVLTLDFTFVNANEARK